MPKVWGLLVAVLLASCASGNKGMALEREIPPGAPKSIKDAAKQAPSDALVGIGYAKMASAELARAIAETRARASIARQINKVTAAIVHNYSIRNAIDPSQEAVFTEVMAVSLSQATLIGARVIGEAADGEGACWVAVMMGRPELIDHIGDAQGEAKEAAPGMDAFNAGALINDAMGSR